MGAERLLGQKLHLGCGEVYLADYVNIDLPPAEHTVQTTSRADEYADIVRLRYPVLSIEEIRLHHVFEHFDRATALGLLVEWYGWLTDGGRLVIETPDFEGCARAFLENPEGTGAMTTLRHVFGSHEAEWAVHREGWYRSKFELFLSRLGFCDLGFTRAEWNGTYNVTVTALKRRPFKTRAELLDVGEKLLRLSLIDGSETEQRLLHVWLSSLRNPGGTAA